MLPVAYSDVTGTIAKAAMTTCTIIRAPIAISPTAAGSTT
jgi:hypothetical protein